MARYSVSACRSCSRNRADSARVRFRSARPHIRPAVRATIVVSRSASADSPPHASVAIHVTTVTPATIATAITAARRRRSGDRAGPDTGDAREPSSAVATSQGDSVNSDNAPSQRLASVLKATSFRSERPFPFTEGRRSTSAGRSNPTPQPLDHSDDSRVTRSGGVPSASPEVGDGGFVPRTPAGCRQRWAAAGTLSIAGLRSAGCDSNQDT